MARQISKAQQLIKLARDKTFGPSIPANVLKELDDLIAYNSGVCNPTLKVTRKQALQLLAHYNIQQISVHTLNSILKKHFGMSGWADMPGYLKHTKKK